MRVEVRFWPNIPSHPQRIFSGTSTYRYAPVPILVLVPFTYDCAPALSCTRTNTSTQIRYSTRTTVRRGARCVRVPEIIPHTRTGLYARCVRVPEITQHTRTGSYHRPNQTRGSDSAMTLLPYEYCMSTALVPVRTGTNIPGRATTVCTGATCVRVPESTNDTRTGLYHHLNKTQGSYHAMSPRLRVVRVYCTRLRIMYRRHMRTVHQPYSPRVYMDYRSASAPPQTPQLAS